jgi:hypothetical protein
MDVGEYYNKGDVTGEVKEEPYRVVHYPFDRYVITILLSPENEFIDITEIRIDKDFLEGRQRIAAIPSIESEPE